MLIAALVLLMAAPEPDATAIVVMPVWGEQSPPQDPTYLRLTTEVAQAIDRASERAVSVYSRDKRAAACADDGHHCPSEVARLLEVHQVVELTIDKSMQHLKVQVWGLPRGLVKEAVVPCEWAEGRPSCDVAAVEGLISGDGVLALDPASVEKALDALMPKIEACKGKRASKKNAKHEVDVVLRFRVTPSGRVREVRVDPRELQTMPAWACVGRAVEALRVPPFRGDESVPFSRVVGRSVVVKAPPLDVVDPRAP